MAAARVIDGQIMQMSFALEQLGPRLLLVPLPQRPINCLQYTGLPIAAAMILLVTHCVIAAAMIFKVSTNNFAIAADLGLYNA